MGFGRFTVLVGRVASRSLRFHLPNYRLDAQASVEERNKMSSSKKPAKQKRELAQVKDMPPSKDAKGGGQKKEVPAGGILMH